MLGQWLETGHFSTYAQTRDPTPAWRTLMRMQNSYDIAQARKREGEIEVAPYRGKPVGPGAATG